MTPAPSIAASIANDDRSNQSAVLSSGASTRAAANQSHQVMRLDGWINVARDRSAGVRGRSLRASAGLHNGITCYATSGIAVIPGAGTMLP